MKLISTLTGSLLALAVLLAIAELSMRNLNLVDAAVSSGSPVFHDEMRIEMGSGGFTPAQVQHAPGTFAIAVENSAIAGEYTLRLKAEDGTVLKEVQVQKGSTAWTITLAAGQYTLTETSHPEWLCHLTVQ